MAHITKRELDNLCEILYAADADIRDIVMFGSFVYAPSLARDLDLVVTTTKRKDYGVYLDAVADFPINVDVIARQPGERIGDRIAWSIKAIGQVLAGDGETLEEVMEVPAPTFDRVRKIFHLADENFSSARNAQDPDINDGYDGNYPIDNVNEEFQRYRDLVEQFVTDLEQAASGDSG